MLDDYLWHKKAPIFFVENRMTSEMADYVMCNTSKNISSFTGTFSEMSYLGLGTPLHVYLPTYKGIIM